MSKKITRITLILFLIAGVIAGCQKGPSSSKRQIKKGDPIPCPIKDC